MPMGELSQTEMIALYLQGELEGKDLEQFNARLATDDTLKREVALQRAIIKNITRAGRHALRSQLKRYHQEILHETEATSHDITADAVITGNSLKDRLRPARRKRTTLLVAACIVTILTVTGLAYYTYLSPERIFNDQFSPYAMRTIRGATPTDITSLYREHNYDGYLSAYQSREIKTLQETFLAGNVYLIKRDPTRAIQCFRQIMTENEKRAAEDQRYDKESEYFLALAHLQNNEPDKADALFKKIMATPQHPYSHKVGKALLFRIRVVRFKLGVNG